MSTAGLQFDPVALLHTMSLYAQVLLPSLLAARRLPRRPKFALRIAIAGALLATGLAGVAVLEPTTGIYVQDLPPLMQVGYFGSALAIVAILIWGLFDTSPWTALLCATTGYALQNLSSSLDNLLCALAGPWGWGSVGEGPVRSLQRLAVIVPVYLLGYRLFLRDVRHVGTERPGNRKVLFTLAVSVLVVIGFGVAVGSVEALLSPGEDAAFRVIHALICAFMLFAQNEMLFRRQLEADSEMAARLDEERRRQYQANEAALSVLNERLHDLVHEVVRLSGDSSEKDRKALADIAGAISRLDFSVRTGCEALDVVITEKNVACAARGITLSCLADGEALAGMPPLDVYLLFDKMLELALTSCEGGPGAALTLSVRRQGELSVAGVEWQPSVGCAPDGLHDLRLVAEKCGGTLEVRQSDRSGKLTVLLAR